MKNSNRKNANHRKSCDCPLCAFEKAHAVIRAWEENMRPTPDITRTILVRAHWRRGKHFTKNPRALRQLKTALWVRLGQ